ncbi:hypothetical protein BKA57DRAFT_450200 [Linnemannia elongata]|nr:hypothetical protein BKA57DRAFT_450200 [Linnemannia elongata]
MVRLLRTSPSISPHSTRLLSHFSFLLLISFFTIVVDSQSTLNSTSLLTTTVSPTLSVSTSILTVPTTSHFSSLLSPSPIILPPSSSEPEKSTSSTDDTITGGVFAGAMVLVSIVGFVLYRSQRRVGEERWTVEMG